VSSNACDGRWHHIAVSRHARELTIYLDGVALKAQTTFEQVAQPALSAGLKVFIGADATAPTPANFFSGMIAEIRVWDTYLNATRISNRMHDKLVGDDPDLIAYWNFDMLSIHDGTRRGHEGKLETAGGSSGYWLADLNFTHPSYPYLETTGEIVQEGTEGGSGSLANTIYKLKVTARSADGAALTNHEVRLWYVRNRNETGPDTIEVLSPTGVTKLGFVPVDHTDDKSLVAKTGSDGKVEFKITTTQRGHGPSLDLRPAFLPPNERYHVNVLIDNQKLQRPSPSRLNAQASLIQDYHWNNGDKVNESRDRSTWRAVITAINSDGRPRAGERLQLWATEHVDVEVDGRTYPINPNNYQSFTADEKGELTVMLAAKELRAPALSVWAGFMHRDERYTIPLDQEVHKNLSKMKPEELTEPQMLNWKPGYQKKALVKDGYKEHAPKVATAIRHVMSVTQEPKPGLRAGVRAKRTRLLTDLRNFSDMRQEEETPMCDRVDSLRTMRHIVRQVPLEPDSFSASLSGTIALKNSIGFVFSKQDLELRPLNSMADVDAAFPRLLTQKEEVPLLGNIFEDAWNFIENAAEAAWREAKRIAIYIADTVTLVIEYADKVVKKVVASVKEAIDAVVHILKMIEALIEEVIRFLMLLFDWSGILAAHRILKKVANNQLKAVREITGRSKDDFLKLITGAFDGSSKPVDLSSHSSREMSAASCRANDRHPQVQAQVNSVHGKYVNDKVDDRRDEIDFGVKPSIKPAETPVDESAASMALEMAGSLTSILGDPLGISFADIYQSIKDLISGDIDKVIKRLLSAGLIDFDKIGKALDCAEAVLNAPIEIPFVTQLYRWITDGEQLTLMDVLCLAMAIPTHIGYAIYTFVTTGTAHKFAKDAEKLDQLVLTAGHFYGEVPLLKSGLGEANVDHNRAMHWCYFVFYQFYTIGSGILKGAQVMNPGGAWKKEFGGMVPPIVVDGLISKTLLYTAGMKEEGWNWFDQTWNSALYGISVLLDLYLALDTFFLEDTIPIHPADMDSEAWKDKAKTAIKVGVSIAGCVLLGLRIDAWVNKKSPLSATFQARDVLNAIGMMFTFDDTTPFVQAVGPENAVFVVAGETYVKIAAGCVHIAAISTAD
jgi:Concanavalin A-like lectin/glucanases superfamily